MAEFLFCECNKCGERWKLGRLPVTLDSKWLRDMKHTRCPNCDERKQLHICPTDGDGAVTEAKNGRKEAHA